MHADTINIVSNVNIDSLYKISAKDVGDIASIPALFKAHRIIQNAMPAQSQRCPQLSNRMICHLQSRLILLNRSIVDYGKLNLFWKIIGIFSGTFFKYKRLQRILPVIIVCVNGIAGSIKPHTHKPPTPPLKPIPVMLPISPLVLGSMPISPPPPDEIPLDQKVLHLKGKDFVFVQHAQEHLGLIAKRLANIQETPLTRCYAPVLRQQPSKNASLQQILQFSKVRDLNPQQINRRDALLNPNVIYRGSRMNGGQLKFTLTDFLMFLKEKLSEFGETIDPVFISGKSALNVFLEEPSSQIEISIFSKDIDGIYFWECVKSYIAYKLGAFIKPGSPLQYDLTHYYVLHSAGGNTAHIDIGNVTIKLRHPSEFQQRPYADKVLIPLTTENLALVI